MTGYTYKSEHGGSTVDLPNLNEFLKLALADAPRRKEFEDMLPLFEAGHCVTVFGGPKDRAPRVMLRVGDVQRYISIRTILAFLANGSANIGMPAPTCEKGCIHPGHAVSTTPMAMGGKLVGRLVVHEKPSGKRRQSSSQRALKEVQENIEETNRAAAH